jgi:hypothetical protein
LGLFMNAVPHFRVRPNDMAFVDKQGRSSSVALYATCLDSYLEGDINDNFARFRIRTRRDGKGFFTAGFKESRLRMFCI